MQKKKIRKGANTFSHHCIYNEHILPACYVTINRHQ